jgi:Tfp pilus assembly protein PilP
MTMKKSILFIVAMGLLGLGPFILSAQEKGVQLETGVLKPPPEKGTYSPAGRRDPFKNLLGGKDIKERSAVGGIPQLSIDDTTLVGIVKTKQKLTAIVSGPQGFPYFIKAGDKFADGYVLAINDYQVVFRKTNERGIPLMRPKDIIKEINPEER